MIQTENINFSDHKLLKVFTTFFLSEKQGHPPNPTSIDFSIFDLNKVNYNEVNKDLNNVNWDEVINDGFENFPDNLRYIVYFIIKNMPVSDHLYYQIKVVIKI